MSSLMTLFSVLVPMFAGFFIRVPKPYLPASDKVLSVLVYAVLLLIGVSLSRVEDLGSRLGDMALTVLWLFVCTVGGEPACLGSVGKVVPVADRGKREGRFGRRVGQCEAARMRTDRFCVRQIDVRYLDAV